jgi:hypothetical protein
MEKIHNLRFSQNYNKLIKSNQMKIIINVTQMELARNLYTRLVGIPEVTYAYTEG